MCCLTQETDPRPLLMKVNGRRFQEGLVLDLVCLSSNINWHSPCGGAGTRPSRLSFQFTRWFIYRDTWVNSHWDAPALSCGFGVSKKRGSIHCTTTSYMICINIFFTVKWLCWISIITKWICSGAPHTQWLSYCQLQPLLDMHSDSM